MILLASLVIIIMLHELGHLAAAKWLGCGVKTFSIGFGKPLVTRTWGRTVYQVAPILLGGYCELQSELTHSRSKYAFTNKTYIQKVIISLAGIGINCWTSVFAYWLFLLTYNQVFLIFGFYSMAIGLSNLLLIPCLDGFYPIIFAFEKIWGKKKTYEFWGKVCKSWFKWIMIANIISLPFLGYLIWTKQIM
jgi:membrane-associated protease RseP (regulator of RpoE activity)